MTPAQIADAAREVARQAEHQLSGTRDHAEAEALIAVAAAFKTFASLAEDHTRRRPPGRGQPPTAKEAER